jgi:hypothetical protein
LFQYFADSLQDNATCIRELNEFDHSLEIEADTASHFTLRIRADGDRSAAA